VLDVGFACHYAQQLIRVQGILELGSHRLRDAFSPRVLTCVQVQAQGLLAEDSGRDGRRWLVSRLLCSCHLQGLLSFRLARRRDPGSPEDGLQDGGDVRDHLRVGKQFSTVGGQ
jgi:hypothetical protein